LHSQTGDGLREKNRANKKNIIFILWSSWLSWVGLGWVGFVGGTSLFFRYVCPFLHSQTGDGLGIIADPMRKTSSLIFGTRGWVGFVGGTCLFFRYVCPFLHSQTGDGLREKTESIQKRHL